MDELNRLVWAGSSTFEVDGLHLGARCTDAEMHQVIRRALRAHLARGVEAPPNYSVQMGHEAAHGRVSGLHFLYRGAEKVVRTRDPERVVRALLNHLSSHARTAPAGMLKVAGTAFVAGDVAVITPSPVRFFLEAAERRLNASGLRVVDTPWALVDPERAELVIPEPALEVDWSELARLGAALTGPRRPDPCVPPGRYPVAGWALLTPREQAGRLRRPLAVAMAAETLMELAEADAQRLLGGLVDAMRNVEPEGINWHHTRPAEMVASLVALL